jgi:hypothetical protein
VHGVLLIAYPRPVRLPLVLQRGFGKTRIDFLYNIIMQATSSVLPNDSSALNCINKPISWDLNGGCSEL